MAYQRGDYRYGNQYRSQDRWRDRERGSRYGSGQGYREDDDRGFFDRAGDEVRSWFGAEEAERRRDRAGRSEESCVGKECVRTGRTRCAPSTKKTKATYTCTQTYRT